MARIASFAVVFLPILFTPACTPAQQAVIDAGLAQGEAGIKAVHDREALALKQAPCAMSLGGYVRALNSAEQGAVLTLCGGEQGLTFEDLADMGRAIRLLQSDAPGRLADAGDEGLAE